jgi:hypothetical protein
VNWVCLAHNRNSEHGVDLGIFCKRIFLSWSFFCISDSVSCNAVNLYTAAIISFCATWSGSDSVQFHVMSEHNCRTRYTMLGTKMAAVIFTTSHFLLQK